MAASVNLSFSSARALRSLLLILSVLCLPHAIAAPAPPPNFAVEQVLSEISQPISMRFLPDGRLLLLQKKGGVLIAAVDSVPGSYEQYFDLSSPQHPDGLNAEQERGLLDIAIDPDFPNEPYIYLLYTPAQGPNGPRMRVSRFTHVENAGDLSSRGSIGSELILWEDSQGYDSCCHFGGGLDFGPDGNLWLSIGDHFQGSYANDLKRAGGKIHRFAKDGSIPADNPYVDGAGPNIDSIFAYGLRNPFRSRWDLPGNRYYIAEVGGNTQTTAWEDLHVIDYDPDTGRFKDDDFGYIEDNGRFDGINFGWPTVEGLPPYTDWPAAEISGRGAPLFAYRHNNKTSAINGGLVYRGTQFPAEFDGAYFYGDSTRDFIRYIRLDSAGKVIPNPSPGPITVQNPDPVSYPFDLSSLGRIVSLEEGPDGALYYISFTDYRLAPSDNPSVLGSLRRYVYEVDNPRPTIVEFTATPASGASPLEVTLNLVANDSNGDTLTYRIDFGDGSSTQSAPLPANTPVSETHVFQQDGVYTVRVYVSDGSRESTSSSVVRAGTPPSISSLTVENSRAGATDGFFRYGDSMTFSATAEDAEDGQLGGASFSWNISFVRPGNIHPALGPESDTTSVEFAIPSQGQGFSGPVFYRAELVVTDSSGLSTNSTINIYPEKANINFETDPSGIVVQVNGNTSVTAPFTLDTLVNWDHTITVPASRCIDGELYEFQSWSNGVMTPQQVLIMPESDINLTASYASTQACESIPENGLVLHLNSAGLSAQNGLVDSWGDQSAALNTLMPVGGPTRLDDELAGYPVVRFDGVDDAMMNAAPAGLPVGNENRTVVMFARYNEASPSTGWVGLAYGKPVNNKTFGLTMSSAGSVGVQGWGSAHDTLSNPAQDVVGRWVSHVAVLNNSTLKQYINGVASGISNRIFNTELGVIRLGEEINGRQNIEMDVAEILVYNRAITANERHIIAEHFENKYGVSQVINRAPVATINSPIAGSTIDFETLPVALVGQASDFEDGDLSDALVWSSSLDGQLGSGSELTVSLSSGVHILTATVQDSEGLPTTSSVSVTVTEDDDLPPSLGISSPQNDQFFQEGTAILFEAQASDVEDGSLDELIEWSSDIDGVLGTGPSLTVATLAVGVHRIQVSVADSSGQQAVSTIRVFVNRQYEPIGELEKDGLILQLESDANISLLSGSTVAGWLDQSGLGNDLEALGNPVLLLDATPNGQSAVQLDGVDDRLERINVTDPLGGLPMANADRTMYIVARFNAPSRYAGVSYGSASSRQAFGLINNPNGTLVLQGYAYDNTTDVDTVAKGWAVFGVVYSGGIATVYDNGLPVLQVPRAYNTTPTRLLIGQEIGGNGYADMDIAAALIYDRALSGAERISVDEFLYAKYISSDPDNQAPSLNIASPAAGQTYPESSPIGLQATALDEEDGDIGASIVWESSIDGILGTGGSLSVVLAEGAHDITATVTDSNGAVGSQTVSITVNRGGNANAAPMISILTPLDSATVIEGTSVNFEGVSTDEEDGDISGDIQWSSSLTGVLGTGATLTVADLPPGVQIITASIEDSDAAKASTSISLAVLGADSEGPTIRILSPASGQNFKDDALITFSGEAADSQDGSLDASIQWTSDIAGPLGSGQSVASSLPSGVHTIQASVTDSDGNPAFVSIQLLVSPSSDPAGVLVTDGLALHLESDADLALDPSGSRITAWRDQSVFGNHLTAFGEPVLLFGETPSGQPAVSLDGVNDKLERSTAIEPLTGLPTGNSDRSMYIVARFNTDSSYAGVAYGKAALNQTFGLVNDPAGNVVLQAYGASFDRATTLNAVDSGWSIFEVVLKNGTASIYRNGEAVLEVRRTFNTVLSKIVLGQEIGVNDFVGLDLAAVLMYDRALNEAERRDVNTFLLSKYLGVTPDNLPPDVAITSPVAGSTHAVANAIALSATAVDPEDGDLGWAIVWESSIDGNLGIGKDLSTALSQGGHTITATATDAEGLSRSMSVAIVVNGSGLPNVSPVVKILSPVDETTVTAGDMVTFSGESLDDEDGDLSGQLVWSSDQNGPLGTGAILALSNLVPGIHTITAVSTDTASASTSSQVLLTVLPSLAGAPFAADLVFRLESDSGVVQNGGIVARWLDYSGQGNHLSAASPPTTGANVTPGGLPSVSFDGVDDNLQRLDAINMINGLPVGNSDRTIFMLVQYRSLSAWAGFAYGSPVANKAFGLVARSPAGELVLQAYGANDVTSSFSGLSSGWAIQSGSVGNGTGRLYLNGALLKSSPRNYATVNSRIYLGAELGGLGYANMDVAAVLVYDRVLSDNERSEVEQYLTNKYLN